MYLYRYMYMYMYMYMYRYMYMYMYMYLNLRDIRYANPGYPFSISHSDASETEASPSPPCLARAEDNDREPYFDSFVQVSWLSHTKVARS